MNEEEGAGERRRPGEEGAVADGLDRSSQHKLPDDTLNGFSQNGLGVCIVMFPGCAAFKFPVRCPTPM